MDNMIGGAPAWHTNPVPILVAGGTLPFACSSLFKRLCTTTEAQHILSTAVQTHSPPLRTSSSARAQPSPAPPHYQPQVMIEVWGEGSTFEELQEAITAFPDELKEPWMQPEQSFRITVEGYGFHCKGNEEVHSIIERLHFLPMKVRGGCRDGRL